MISSDRSSKKSPMSNQIRENSPVYNNLSNNNQGPSNKLTSSESSLNSIRFNHPLFYSSRCKNSTVKSRYFKNRNLNLSSQLGYSNLDTLKNQTTESTMENYPGTESTSENYIETESNSGPVRFNHPLFNSSRCINSTLKSRYFRNRYLENNPETESTSSPSDDQTSTTDLNNNDINNNDINNNDINNNNFEYDNSYSEDYLEKNHYQVPVCFSYLKDCAIYGIPDAERKKELRKLLNWHIFSITYDMKWFVKKEWKRILILFAVFILIDLVYLYKI